MMSKKNKVFRFKGIEIKFRGKISFPPRIRFNGDVSVKAQTLIRRPLTLQQGHSYTSTDNCVVNKTLLPLTLSYPVRNPTLLNNIVLSCNDIEIRIICLIGLIVTVLGDNVLVLSPFKYPSLNVACHVECNVYDLALQVSPFVSFAPSNGTWPIPA